MKTLSFRDDLESLGYSILHLLVGGKGYWFDDAHLFAKPFIDKKLEFIESRSDDPRLLCIRDFLRYVQKMDFKVDPDYNVLK